MNIKSQKLSGLSTLGYMIVLVMIIGVVMIVFTPFIAKNSNEEMKRENEQLATIENNIIQEETSALEERLNQRINLMENRIMASQRDVNSTVSNKFLCTIEGRVGNNGNIVSVDEITNNKKFVFVCEYKN